MSESEDESVVDFHSMGLDDRLLKAIQQLKWKKPFPIQEKAIPFALNQGKDILGRAGTGSGKTGAFAISIIQRILHSKRHGINKGVKNESGHSVRAVVIAPKAELCEQITKVIKDLCFFCSKDVCIANIAPKVPLKDQRQLFNNCPDIVVGTPNRFLAHLQANYLILKDSLEMVVVDEADLVFSFGCEEEMKQIRRYFPNIYQAILMSATLSEDVKKMKTLMLRNPVILRLEGADLPDDKQLSQYQIKCNEDDKYVLLYSFVKCHVIKGKSIVFVNNVNRCYRLKLFLEQFGIPSCVLNSELPMSFRVDVVNKFNDGNYNIIIAADEQPEKGKKKKKKNLKFNRDPESGIARGIDFHRVTNVINFDFPLDTNSYVHRVGRTARADREGNALSFVTINEQARMDDVEKQLKENGGLEIKPFQFNMANIEGFRYRANDALRAITKQAVQNARKKEMFEKIKFEACTSSSLKDHFELNPKYEQMMRADKPYHSIKMPEHLRNVPDYLVPKEWKSNGGADYKAKKRRPKTKPYERMAKNQDRYRKRTHDSSQTASNNPLKTFTLLPKKKKK